MSANISSSESPLSITIATPQFLSNDTALAAFALFLHRTFSIEELFIGYVDKNIKFVFSSIDNTSTFADLQNRLSYHDKGLTPYFFSTAVLPDAPLGVFFNSQQFILCYQTDKYEKEMVLRWKEHLEKIIALVVEAPFQVAKKLCYLSKQEKELLNTWNNTKIPFPEEKLLHEFIEEQVSKTPEAEAARFHGVSITYRELNERANALAYLLRKQGVGKDMPVAICMERSIELVIGLVGILKAGGAYVPMDPSYPEERLHYILSDSQSKVLLTETGKKALFANAAVPTLYLDNPELLKNEQTSNPSRINSSEDLCYIIYTSGSTGKPKGAGNIHKGVVNRILWMHSEYKLTPKDRILQKTPFGFDVSVWEFFWPLMTGATLVMAEPGIHKDAEALAELIEKEKITHLHFVPSMLSLFLEADVSPKCCSIKKVFTSGEALSYDLQTRFFQQYQAELHNLYGPTEASIDVTYWPCNPKDTRTIVPIGYPIANTQIYILDEFLSPVPIGVAGELFIGGVGLARGYIHRKELTKEKFIEHPFIKGERLYRTGDLCRFLSDGAIEYLGRIDHQIKLRGFRIELGEIEAVIKKHPDVKKAVVIAREDTPGDKYLSAYLILNDENALIKEELISAIGLSLPEYMIPSSFVLMDEFPLSPNGKLDTKKLPTPKEKERTTAQAFVEPITPLQKDLASIWKEILGLNRVGIHDNFFALGGHSLLAMRLALKIKKGVGKSLSLPEIFQYPTIETQANLLEQKENCSVEQSIFTSRPDKRLEAFPLTDIQRAYLLGRTDAFALGEIRSHLYIENEFDALDIPLLEKAFNRLIERHEMLRATILEDGTQKITEDVPYYSIPVHTGSFLETRQSILDKMKNGARAEYYDVCCTKTEEGKIVVHFFFDLLVADGTGLEVIFEELSSYYRHFEKELPSIGATYRDYILALENKGASFEKAKEYWHKRIDSMLDAPELPTKLLQQDSPPAFVRRRGGLSSQEWKDMQAYASKAGITAAALLVTIYGEVLKTWSKSPHFTLNLMFFNRPPIHPDIERIVGNFSTTLLLEMNLSGKDPLKEKAIKIQKQLLSDLEHSEYNGIKVLNEMNRRKGGSSAAAMPVVFACALNLRARDESREPNLFKWYGKGVSYNQLETPQVWLDHQVFEEEDGSLCFFWDVRDAYFPDAMIDDMFERYQTALKQIAHTPDRVLDLLPESHWQVIDTVNGTFAPFEEGCLHSAIFEKAKEYPHALAISTAHTSLCYGELAATSLELASNLSALSLSSNDLVAIVMEKGWEQIVSALAIHIAGAAYLPIDAALPKERILQLLSISGAKALFTQKPLDFEVSIPYFVVDSIKVSEGSLEVPPLKQTPSDLAYVIFTSGSTGTPKGVMIQHKAALNTVEAINKKYGVTHADKAFAISSLSFDLSVYDVFGLLRAGGSLYIPTKEETKNPQSWLKAIKEQKITLWNSAPALMQVLMDTVELSEPFSSSLRLVAMSGDWIPVTLPEKIMKHFPAKVVSLGGATEASIWSNDYPIDHVEKEWTSIPYGKPLPNQSMMVLDDCLEPRPFWVTGMIYIGGEGLSLGYLGDEEKTKKSFVFHPLSGEKLYRTGDLGRLHPDGNIEFLGREDLQVKIQGYRIELEEIEAAIRILPEIDQVLVRILGAKHEAKRLVAFYIQKQSIEPSVIKDHLEKRLPFYMVPNHFVCLEIFPLSSNGKVDLKALVSLMKESGSQAERKYEAPQGALEEALSGIWKELLHIEKIGRTDNFFALGGTSFLAFQMIHRVQKELGLSFSLSTLFQKGTIAELLQASKSHDDPSFVVLQSAGKKEPMFFVHPSGGGVLCYTELAKDLRQERPFYAFQAPGFMDLRHPMASVKELAAQYLKTILAKQKTGPYLLGGWSFGGVISFEIASMLKKMGKEVLPIIMIDSPIPYAREDLSDETLFRWFAEDYGGQLNSLDEKSRLALFSVFKAHIQALSSYKPETAAIDIVMMKATNVLIEHLATHPMKDRNDWGWSILSTGNILCHLFDADHNSILKEPHLSRLVELILQTGELSPT